MRWFWSFVAILAIAGVAVLATVGDHTSTGSGVVDAGARGEATATASSTAAPDDAARTDLDRKDTGRQEADRLDTAPKPSDRTTSITSVLGIDLPGFGLPADGGGDG
ncbi:MAG: hypothetical protein RIS86_1179, partial [Planctomycetota bacterium]